MGYSPFGQGDFPKSSSRQGQALETIASKHRKTPRQVALNFLTRRGGLFAIPKSSDVDHVRENSGGAGWNLDQEDINLIDNAFPLPPKNQPLDMI